MLIFSDLTYNMCDVIKQNESELKDIKQIQFFCYCMLHFQSLVFNKCQLYTIRIYFFSAGDEGVIVQFMGHCKALEHV